MAANDPGKYDRILELRIHGVKNTPPGVMLGVDESAVVRWKGDDLGGFFTETHPTADGNVRREAYSWGGMARSGAGPLALIGQLFVHIGWLLILPFGLCNVAYWARRLPRGDARGGTGATSIRLFALGLTLFYVTALASVAIDLIGVQCYRAAGVCSQLPGVFDALASLDRAPRLALLSLIPVIGVLVLFLIARRARVSYQPSIVAETARPTDDEDAPLLATPGFWMSARVSSGTERLHVAASILLVVVLLNWDFVFAATNWCGVPLEFVARGCLGLPGPLSENGLSAVILAISGIGIIVAAWMTSTDVRPERIARRRAGTWVVLLAAFALFALTFFATATPSASGERDLNGTASGAFLGLVSTPAVIIAVLLAIAIAAVGWRRGVPGWLSGGILALTLVVPIARIPLAGLEWIPSEGFLIVTAALVVVQLALAFFWPLGEARRKFEFEGWRGAGPGVMLLLSAGAAMVLSSLLVVGVAAWLAVPVTTGKVDGMWRAAAVETIDSRGATIDVPDAFVEFGVALLAILVALIVLVGPAVAWAFRPVRVAPGGVAKELLEARRFAAALHRGEPVLGILAVAIGVGLIATLVASVPEKVISADDGGVLGWLASNAPPLAVSALSITALAAVAAVGTNALTVAERPVALLWDLICFLPRAGHPFAPPCYSERVVPELNSRIREWLGSRASFARSRQVIVSAHSMGAVLAVASLFALHGERDVPMNRIGFLTYGIQLRPYFGRFFPELLGPGVLGTRPCRAPSLYRRDPWARQVEADDEALIAVSRGRARATTLAGVLSDRDSAPAWQSLWRRTDYLGFPVTSYDVNAIDVPVGEIEPRTYLHTIASHSNYPHLPEYDTAFSEVVRRLPPSW